MSSSDLNQLQTYLALTVSALLPIYLGSYASIQIPKTARRAIRKARSKTPAEEEEESDEDEEEEVDRLTSSDAWWFPVIGSVVLLGLYMAIKYLDKDVINKILLYYFATLGAAALGRAGVFAIKWLLGSRWDRVDRYKVTLTKNLKEMSSLRFTPIHVITTIFSILLSVFQLFFPRWQLANLFALTFSFNAISLLRLDTFQTGAILLGGLFFYDVWWVFGTEVMVSVAKGIDAPIKITWPRDLSAPEKGASMLGLGDIVIPGVFVALALRYDYHRALTKSAQRQLPNNKPATATESTPLVHHPNPHPSTTTTTTPPLPSSSYPKPYFTTCFISYILGLTTTMAVMHTFKAAQPALLYLSPACVGSVLICALVKGEWGEMWNWVDGEEEGEGEGKGGKGGKGKEVRRAALEDGGIVQPSGSGLKVPNGTAEGEGRSSPGVSDDEVVSTADAGSGVVVSKKKKKSKKVKQQEQQ